jgi:hypothetical protein
VFFIHFNGAIYPIYYVFVFTMILTAESCEQYFKVGAVTRRYSVIGCNGYEIANPTDNISNISNIYNIAVETKDVATSTSTSTSTTNDIAVVEEKEALCAASTCAASTCAICMEDVGQKNMASTECGHTFCLSCLLSQLKHSNSCPLCRTPIDQNVKKVLKPLSYSDGIALLDHELNAIDIYDSVEQYVQNAIEVSANPQTDGRNVDSIIEDFMILIGSFGFNLLYDAVCHINGGEHNVDQEWVVEMYGDDDNSDDDNSDDDSEESEESDSNAGDDDNANISGDEGDE